MLINRWLAMISRSYVGGLLTLVLVTGTTALAEDKPAEPAAAKDAAAPESKPEKTVAVQLKDLKLNVPESWKQGEPNNRLRLGQFEIPAVKDDEEAAELTVFNFGGGGDVRANVDRWIAQFDMEGRKEKVTLGKLENGQYVFVDVNGTYRKPIGPPIRQQTKLAPGYRMLGVIIAQEDIGIYYLKLTGPARTVEHNAAALRGAFGGNAEKEEPLKLGEE